MKTKLLFITALFLCLFFANSQNDIMYVMKGDGGVDQYDIATEIDSIIFYNPTVTPPNQNSNTYITGKIPNAKYIGRWDTSGEIDKGYWNTSCVKVNVTGTTSIKIEYNKTGAFAGEGFAYSINEAPVTLVFQADMPGFGGIVEMELANSLDPSKEYTLTIYNGPGKANEIQSNKELTIRNLILDQGGTTLPPSHLKPILLEFIGDSITEGYGNNKVVYDNYSYLISQILDTEVVNISRSGGTLYSNLPVGTMYFDTPSNYDFNQYHPDLIFINLGTNSGTYTSENVAKFFRELRAVHPDAYIVMMSLFKSQTTEMMKTQIEGAIQIVGDPKILFTSGKGILSAPNGVDYYDFNHPNEQGNQKAAEHFAPIIAGVLGIN